ncbi:MAG: protoporphyrinogen oxidase [Planctomycetota bacterium]
MATSKSIAIIGGGITGLSAAYYASKLIPEASVTLFESSQRLGGVLQSTIADDFLIEHSADMFTTEPSTALDLCRELGKEQELVSTIPVKTRACVASENGIHPIPHGLSLMLPGNLDAIMSSELLDSEGKKRFLAEADVPIRDSIDDECLDSFARRRFGDQAFENLIQPLVSGIYTADPTRLSMQATMKRFVDMEREHGSLIAAAKAKAKQSDRNASGARYDLFRAPRLGMGQLATWLSDAVPHVSKQMNAQVQSVKFDNGTGWVVSGVQAKSEAPIEHKFAVNFDAVIIALAAKPSGKLLTGISPELPASLDRVESASSAVIAVGLRKTQLKNNFEGYGIIYPAKLGRKAIACSFTSNKFPGRAPDDSVMIRVFVGGALQPGLVELDDEDLSKLAITEIHRTLGLEGQPLFTKVLRWKNCMPQYHVGHLDLLDQIHSLVEKQNGLELAGNSYGGVGIPACIDSGRDAVKRIQQNWNVLPSKSTLN